MDTLIIDMPSYTDDYKGFYDWKCPQCKNMFHQQMDLDVVICPTCWDKNKTERENKINQKSRTYNPNSKKPLMLTQEPLKYGGKVLKDNVWLLEE
jgi:uncharacterized Zn finger protein (UPF0148 family)